MGYDSLLDSLRQSRNFRTVPPDTSESAVVDLSSNDYLGIGADSALRREFLEYALSHDLALTSSASRLLAGRQREYHRLESLLDSLYAGRETLLFNSGYHANTGLIPALSEGRTLIVADRLSHASIIDGIVLSRCPFERFRHNDYGHLRDILRKKSGDFSRVLVATESVFSMDGDRCDIATLVELRREFPGVMLYVDEAHAFGVEGRRGLGLVADSGLADEVDVIVGTFGKAAASEGAFCSVKPPLRDVAVNRARSFIFSTSVPPLNVAWTAFVVERMTAMDDARGYLRRLSALLSDVISDASGKACVPSHIQPLIVGDSARAVGLSGRLLSEGFKVLPIRTPTVPAGTERLRFSLSAALSEADVLSLGRVLKRIMDEER